MLFSWCGWQDLMGSAHHSQVPCERPIMFAFGEGRFKSYYFSHKITKEPREWLFRYCLWATKKIFLPFLRMNSNSRINEILADARLKSANADEIFGFASDEIKSTHSPSRRISPNEVGFHRRRRFHPPARVDLVEKSTDKVDAFFLVRVTGLDGLCPSFASALRTPDYVRLRRGQVQVLLLFS